MALAAVVLAAGGGTRMNSRIPKTLHQLAGVPMLRHVLESVGGLCPDRMIVVAGEQWREIGSALGEFAPEAEIALQPKQLGTADAVMAARKALSGFEGRVVVLYGDTPLVRDSTVNSLICALDGDADVAILGFRSEDPSGYGRLITSSDGELERIVEHKDATDTEKHVDFCNSGIVCAEAATLFSLLENVGSDNAAGEFYLTDIVAVANDEGLRCCAIEGSEEELHGVNSRMDLARAEQSFQERARTAALKEGVTLMAPDTIFFGFGTTLGVDVVIETHVVIGPQVSIADGAFIRSFSHLENCCVGRGATVGPFARIRPETKIGKGTRIGNFVEIKASVVGDDAKVPHLSYVGDTEVGAGANIGAGTITCNYDGVSKHRTRIGDDAFIGSNSTLIAPVIVSDGAVTAAGSVITHDVPPKAIAIARKRQMNLKDGADRLFRRLRGNVGSDNKPTGTTSNSPAPPDETKSGN